MGNSEINITDVLAANKELARQRNAAMDDSVVRSVQLDSALQKIQQQETTIADLEEQLKAFADEPVKEEGT